MKSRTNQQPMKDTRNNIHRIQYTLPDGKKINKRIPNFLPEDLVTEIKTIIKSFCRRTRQGRDVVLIQSELDYIRKSNDYVRSIFAEVGITTDKYDIEEDDTQTRKGYTYFIQDVDDETAPIKIGFTSGHPHIRLKALQTSNPAVLCIRGLIEGDIERELHCEFYKTRLSGEWFRATHELVKYIKDKSIVGFQTFAPTSLKAGTEKMLQDLTRDETMV